MITPQFNIVLEIITIDFIFNMFINIKNKIFKVKKG